ncbi:MAG: LPS-assembly protein LptD [Caulobacteraceae bacterium]|nr:LPS-assembly protein LptD [Caulobacteraceae bacterium]
MPSELPKTTASRPKPVPVDDGLGQRGFYLEADTLIRDDHANSWTARGSVEARYQGRVLRGDEVIYNIAAGTVVANGHAQIIQPDGTVQTADHIVLDDKMRAGFARGFALHTPENMTFAADVAVRRSETVNELSRAVYTPCQICAEDGSPETPSWSISASKVIQDHQRHLVYYRNAVLSIKGVPVFYTPVFWHPDPDSPRASGLLMPKASSSTKRGLSYEQPYLQVISPSQELTISPQINTKENPFLNLEWRKQFYSGQIDARFGYTYERDFDGKGNKFGALTSRSFVLANGAFDLNSNWSWGFDVDRTSDALLFQKYDISNVYENHGPYNSDSQRLLSQIFATRQDSNSYLSISALDFQGLRTNAAGITENSGAFPVVAPLIEARYEPAAQILGGRLRFVGSAVVLSTSDSAVDPTQPGPDSRRATAEVNWQRNFTVGPGIRLSPFLDLRGDFYNVSNPTATDHGTYNISRGVGTAGLDVSWPFIKQAGSTSIILEPLGQIALSPNITQNSHIPNEDSVVTTFDETNLFSTDHFSGYDLIEGGQRVNVGGRATVAWGDGLSARLLLGRTFRAQTETAFPAYSGLNGHSSNWVVAADTTPVGGLSIFSRALLDDSFNAQNTEVGVNFAHTRTRGYIRYDDDNTQPTGRTRSVEGAGEFFVTRHWGVSLVGIRDLQVSSWRKRNVGLIYMDDCIRVEVVYQHEDTVVGRLGKSDAVFVRLKLATLDGEGYKNADFH